MDLFTAAAEARDEAIARVDAHADPEWKDLALEAIRQVALTHASFIVDDVWTAGLPKPREGRAIGAVMLRAARLGWIERTGEYRASGQVQCHGNVRAVWRSLVCRERAA